MDDWMAVYLMHSLEVHLNRLTGCVFSTLLEKSSRCYHFIPSSFKDHINKNLLGTLMGLSV